MSQVQPMERSFPELGWTIDDWRDAVVSGELDEAAYLEFFSRCPTPDAAWIAPPHRKSIRAQWRALFSRENARELRLCGVPFAVKDNIDVAGFPTTAACPAFAYEARADARVVQLLRDAGAIFVGKTNLDQFATGLVGTRSPYGEVENAIHPDYICGGSSSGSASVVARGLVPFSLGTDTAGSGRVPAAFNRVVGLKPTRGRFSTCGVVPACRTLDCVSIFALTVADADRAASVLDEYDPSDPYARLKPSTDAPWVRTGLRGTRFGVFEVPEFYGDGFAKQAYEATIGVLRELGVQFATVDFAPFSQMAQLLYQSAWVAERSLVAKDILGGPAEWMDANVRRILLPASQLTAEEAFSAEYRRAALARTIGESLTGLDALLVPTTPTIYRRREVHEDPLGTNARLGTYTNFTNLADLSAVAVPGVGRSDGLPAGITLLAPAWADAALVNLAALIQKSMREPLGVTGRLLSDESEPTSEGDVGGAAQAGLSKAEKIASIWRWSARI